MENKSAEMSFSEHLRELRTMLIQISIGIILGIFLSYYLAPGIIDFLSIPAKAVFKNVEFIGTGPADAFVVKLKVALFASIVITLPWTLFHFWKFFSPALYDAERGMMIPFVTCAFIAFLAGVSFCYTMVLPVALGFLFEEFNSINVQPSIKINDYISFAVGMMLIFGGSFQLPLIAFILARLRLLTAKFLIDKFRYSIVIIFIVGGILSPPDVVSQLLLSIPLLILYVICIFVCLVTEKKRKELVIKT